MSYLKKFTDFCGGLAAFLAAVYFIRKYMAYEPPLTDADAPSKLEQFLKPAPNTDYTMLIPLILALALSVVIGRIFARLPYVCLGASIIPALYVAYMYGSNLLFDRRVPIIVLCALHVVGNVAECTLRDREDGRHRLWIGAKITSLSGALLCLFTTKLADKPLPSADADPLPLFETEVISTMTPENMSALTTLGWIFLALLAISILLYNVYFIDAIISLIPLGFTIYSTFAGTLTIAPKVFITISLICTATHLMLAVFENNLSLKEQKGKAA